MNKWESWFGVAMLLGLLAGVGYCDTYTVTGNDKNEVVVDIDISDISAEVAGAGYRHYVGDVNGDACKIIFRSEELSDGFSETLSKDEILDMSQVQYSAWLVEKIVERKAVVVAYRASKAAAAIAKPDIDALIEAKKDVIE